MVIVSYFINVFNDFTDRRLKFAMKFWKKKSAGIFAAGPTGRAHCAPVHTLADTVWITFPAPPVGASPSNLAPILASLMSLDLLYAAIRTPLPPWNSLAMGLNARCFWTDSLSCKPPHVRDVDDDGWQPNADAGDNSKIWAHFATWRWSIISSCEKLFTEAYITCVSRRLEETRGKRTEEECEDTALSMQVSIVRDSKVGVTISQMWLPTMSNIPVFTVFLSISVWHSWQ